MKKGFTLIELLAVIVILAIIALIAVPVILSTIDDAKKNSATNSAKLYVDGLQKRIAAKSMMGEYNPAYCIVTNGNIVCDSNDFDYETTGEKPASGIIGFDSGSISWYTLCIMGHRVTKNGTDITTIKDSNCTLFGGTKVSPSQSDTHKGIVYLDPTNLSTHCTEEIASNNLNSKGKPTGITSGCMKFYIYDDAGDNYKMILDHNTSGQVAWNSSGDNSKMNEVQVRLLEDTKGWVGNPRLISANEIAHLVGVDVLLKWDQSKPIGSTPESTNSDTQVYNFRFDPAEGDLSNYSNWSGGAFSLQGTSKYAWLFDNTQGCVQRGCNEEDNNVYPYPTKDSSNSYNIFGYWTSSSVVGTSSAWNVYHSGFLGNTTVAKNYEDGVRPVITLPKSIFD